METVRFGVEPHACFAQRAAGGLGRPGRPRSDWVGPVGATLRAASFRRTPSDGQPHVELALGAPICSGALPQRRERKNDRTSSTYSSGSSSDPKWPPAGISTQRVML